MKIRRYERKEKTLKTAREKGGKGGTPRKSYISLYRPSRSIQKDVGQYGSVTKRKTRRHGSNDEARSKLSKKWGDPKEEACKKRNEPLQKQPTFSILSRLKVQDSCTFRLNARKEYPFHSLKYSFRIGGRKRKLSKTEQVNQKQLCVKTRNERSRKRSRELAN